MSQHKKHRHGIRGAALLVLAVGFFCAGVFSLFVATWKLPDISAFSERKVVESTKIYDRTGEVLLYDLYGNAKRTVIPYAEISRHLKNATVAIEDSEFFSHRGIRFKAILRAAFANLFSGEFSQGGSTITQQVVKNSLLTSEKTLSRKFKEWVLSWKMEQAFPKEKILELYLNEAPYGGTIYGVEEASRAFFGKSGGAVSVAEAAYLAALPNAPTFYSPYGNNRDKLEGRKNLVLRRMREGGFISEEEYERAAQERAVFKPDVSSGILAPHLVIFVRQYLEERYGRAALEEQGLTVITTLDYELQKIAEGLVREYALKNHETFDAENAALLALDPKTGQILAMVGSRDYFDKDIDGNFNATLAKRQPGSAFKPFVYAAALRKGFTPETVVFDVPTEFSTFCNPDGTPINAGDEDKCYKPENYDGKNIGPVRMRDALAQSINVPSVKVLYLAGLSESLALARDLGLTTLTTPERYGLTLVLGGGEVKLLELTSAYGVFAAEGVRSPPTAVLRVLRKDGAALEEWRARNERVLEEDIAQELNDMLSDNRARAPAFGERSPLYFPGRDVAVKTGTTNDYRDAWIVGYAPNIAVGAWAGNNDNRPMQKKIAAFIVAPLWNAFMQEALKRLPNESFRKPPQKDISSLPPILRGVWQGGQTYAIDKLSGALATEFTPAELREERAVREVHSILYWIDKANPTVPRAASPVTDPQFPYWEYAVRSWAQEHNLPDETAAVIPTTKDDVHTLENAPRVSLLSPAPEEKLPANGTLLIRVALVSRFAVARVNFFLTNTFIGSATKAPWQLTLPVSELGVPPGAYELRAVAYDVVQNRGEVSVSFSVAE
jgi:penicillin-binding protein 1C